MSTQLPQLAPPRTRPPSPRRPQVLRPCGGHLPALQPFHALEDPFSNPCSHTSRLYYNNNNVRIGTDGSGSLVAVGLGPGNHDVAGASRRKRHWKESRRSRRPQKHNINLTDFLSSAVTSSGPPSGLPPACLDRQKPLLAIANKTPSAAQAPPRQPPNDFENALG